MNQQLMAALDQALNSQIEHLFSTLFVNKINKPSSDEPILAFNKGLTIAVDAYMQACLAVDKMTEA